MRSRGWHPQRRPWLRAALLGTLGFSVLGTWADTPRLGGEVHAGPRPWNPDDDDDDEDHDAYDRSEAREDHYPVASDQVMAQWDAIRRSEARRWADRLPGQGQGAFLGVKVGQVPGQSWVNIGPSDATIEYNDNNFFAFDTGRPNTLIFDPRDPNIVYYGASAGGVWKSYNFVSGQPHPAWVPLSDGLTDLSVGAMALDPNSPDTIYVGNGDAYDSFAGGTVWKSTDAGATWTAPVVLKAAYPFGLSYRPTSIRDLQVDPKDSKHVLVSTRGGLFQSHDGGASFAWIDLPNGSDIVTEATWSVVYLGGTSWLVSGVSSCAPGQIPPSARNGALADPMKCPLGAVGDIWRSDDSGATWSSLRHKTGALPAPPTGDDIGRITLAAGNPKNPAATVVYAYVANATGRKTLGFWRSRDGGLTWQVATGMLQNPTLPDDRGRRECGDMNLGHGQSWYNQALAVDPQSDDHVIAGGNLCGIRTLNGTAASPVWENVSHWLPIAGGTTSTVAGPLAYAHADWHTATVAKINGKSWVLAGNDGGMYLSQNVFDASVVPTDVTWSGQNRGIVTHLMYGVGSGDPSWGNSLVVFTGLQDNGTFARNTSQSPSTFTGVLGGDGIGAAVNKGTAGEFYWISVEGGRYFCVANETDCTLGNYINWWNLDPKPGMGDGQPFFVYYSPILSDPTGAGFLTQTNNQVWKTNLPPMTDPYDCSVLTGQCKMGWQAISPDFSKVAAPNGPNSVRNSVAARNIADLYGAVLSGKTNAFAITSDGGANWSYSTLLPNNGSGLYIGTPSSLDFPLAPTTGKMPGDEYVAASAAPSLSDGLTPIPDSLGHLFATSDRGLTWTSIRGYGGKSPLPNVPIYVVKYDPMDAKTLYVGTSIGVYVTRDSGGTWERLGSGLPMVEASDIYIAKNQDFIRVSTYGRGLWEINPSDNTLMGASGDGDYDRNLQIDWVDLAAMASRLGETPSTTDSPLYTYVCDMVGSLMAPDPDSGPMALIDDADLTALLARFGGHP